MEIEPKLTSLEPERVGEEESSHDLVIIGGGPAGLTAAIYAGRARIDTLVLAGSLPGGYPVNTYAVENFPGFPDGISGPELAQRFQSQADRFGAQIVPEAVTEVDFSARPFEVRTERGTYRAFSAIVATGAQPRRLNVPGEDQFYGRGVSACATCDGFFYRDKRVAVVGGGDSAVDEAIFLTRFAREVVIIHRRDELRATEIYQERAFANPKIRIAWDSIVERILGGKTVEGVQVRNVKTNETSVIDVDGVFIYVGMEPKTDIFQEQLELDDQGYIVSNRRQSTSVPGVFVAGDVQDPHYRQVVVAAGTGAIAAMEVERFLCKYPEGVCEFPGGVW
ncbi:MAG: thioredoxin-disulfide reductase [Anaerolineae bacterium]|jgi:thioredoxin reductase (NADPH)